jgi:acylphosphatase
MDPESRAIIVVSGRVQGVGFRYSTLEKAKSLRLKGFVKNLPNESVYIDAQGSPDALEDFIQWCRMGPPRASVEKMDFTYQELTDFTCFQIR